MSLPSIYDDIPSLEDAYQPNLQSSSSQSSSSSQPASSSSSSQSSSSSSSSSQSSSSQPSSDSSLNSSSNPSVSSSSRRRPRASPGNSNGTTNSLLSSLSSSLYSFSSPVNGQPDIIGVIMNQVRNSSNEEKKISIESIIQAQQKESMDRLLDIIKGSLDSRTLSETMIYPVAKIDALSYFKKIMNSLAIGSNPEINTWGRFYEIVEDALMFCFMNNTESSHQNVIFEHVKETSVLFMKRFRLAHGDQLPDSVKTELSSRFNRAVFRSNRLHGQVSSQSEYSSLGL
jgi:hypothetical protein